MDYQYLLFENENGVAKLTLNTPESGNALHLDMRAELLDAFDVIDSDDSIRSAVITGAGKNFCTGGDIRTMEGVTPVGGRDRLKYGHKLVKKLVAIEKPIIAAVNGAAAGAGASLAIACDMLIAADNTRIIIPFVKIGLTPDWGLYYFLPSRIGMAKTKELMLTGDPVSAIDAERMGLINRVVPASDLMDEAMSLAGRLAEGPAVAYAMIKAALNHWPNSLDTMLEMEATMQAVAMCSEDFDEGRRAFLEKRKPKFIGK